MCIIYYYVNMYYQENELELLKMVEREEELDTLFKYYILSAQSLNVCRLRPLLPYSIKPKLN